MNKKWISVPAAALMVLGTASAAAAASVTPWHQGFETDTAGWLDSSTADPWYGSIERVPSGTNDVSSAAGGSHAVVNGDDDSAPFSRFAGYSSTWDGAWIAEVAVHLDPEWESGVGFDYTVAASRSNGDHLRDFIFHVTKDSSTGTLLVAGSNNTNFAAREDLETINHYEVTEAGWYTLQHAFYEDGGALSVDLNLLDADGDVVWTETRTNTDDTIGVDGVDGVVGGNRYSWFTFVTTPDLAIDNHKVVPVPAKPVSKDQCEDGTWEAFGFKNQGQCIASLQANEKAGK